MTSRRTVSLVASAALCLFAAGLGAELPSAARAGTAAGSGAGPLAAAGANLLLNAGAQAGAASAQGYDAVTIPGWSILSGLPTVVRYGTPGFPAPTGRQPRVRGGQLFAGGAGGRARLQQEIPLRTPRGDVVAAGTRFRLAGWLGAPLLGRASVEAQFFSASGRLLGSAAIGPVAGDRRIADLSHRAVSGVLPAGTASARISLTLATTRTDNDGPYAPLAGYNGSAADDLQFSLSAPVRGRALVPPAARVPRYQHVFLFYFENEDYGALIGNRRQAPFLNSLLPHASVLGNFFAEEHPSDANYLALAGGSAFGIPLDDPLEENPQYTIHARNISDLLAAAHESWKVYLQSANGPCDDTVHGYYWDDDMPMTYFADVRDRPAFCASHLVPLEALQGDLTSAKTTPAFAWIAPDDCSDMEGCGIEAGDTFLATELSAIMRSPAWRTQRSLAIITVDEDGYDNEHPAQRVATVILGSAGVRQGYVSRVRYTHYSLLRTIEAALGLSTLTANDRYAAPVNDVFSAAAAAAPAAAAGLASDGTGLSARTAGAGAPAPAPPLSASAEVRTTSALAGDQPTAFVVNSASGTVTPVGLVTHRAYKAIRVGRDPEAIAVTPDGAMAYVVNSGSDTVTPISTKTGATGPPIRVGDHPQDIAITPDGAFAYVTNMGSDTVTPIDLLTGAPGAPIPVGTMPRAIVMTPDGRTALVADWGGGSVTPIRLPDPAVSQDAQKPGQAGRAGRAIRVGSYPAAITVSAADDAAYVASYGSDTVTPISLGSWRAGAPVRVGQAPDALAATPDGGRLFVVNGDSDTLTSLQAAATSLTPAPRTIGVGYSPAAVAVAGTGPGQTAFVVNTISGTLTPVSVATGRSGRPITIGLYSYPTDIELAPSGPTAVVLSPYAGQVTLVNTASRRAIATVTVGSYPVAAAIAP
jgi:YVTN family beta-propeller protein